MNKKGILEQAIVIAGTEVKNRIVFQPMEGCDGTYDGGFSELAKRRYMRFAESGAGIIWMEAIAVCHEGRGNPRHLWLHEKNLDEYKQLISAMKKRSIELYGYAPVIIAQLTHSGRQSRPVDRPQPRIAIRNAYLESIRPYDGYTVATDEYCVEIESLFEKSARLAVRAGFDGVDVKCCHGYLLNEFLSAYKREGLYGGSLENRSRLYLNCVKRVKNAVGDSVLVTTRLGIYDGFSYPYGYGTAEGKGLAVCLDDARWLLSCLKKIGIELVNITMGNPYINPHVNRPHINGVEDGNIGVTRITAATRQLQEEFPELSMVLSGVTFERENAMSFCEKFVETGGARLVGFGRMTLAYPMFYQDYLRGGLKKEKCCLTCGTCSRMMRAGGVAGCPVFDKEVYCPIYKELAAKNGGKL